MSGDLRDEWCLDRGSFPGSVHTGHESRCRQKMEEAGISESGKRGAETWDENQPYTRLTQNMVMHDGVMG